MRWRYTPAVVTKRVIFGNLVWIELRLLNQFDTGLPPQFMLVWVPGYEAIPMSIAYADEDSIGMVVRPVGPTTHRLASMKCGEYLGVIGPLGKPLVPSGHGEIMLVGGGSGVAPIIRYAQVLQERGTEFRVYIGVRDGAEAEVRKVFEEKLGVKPIVSCETRVGEHCDYEGLVTSIPELRRDVKSSTVIAAGPLPMLKALFNLVNDCSRYIVVLESMIKCGVGFCGSCRLWDTGPLLCREGPGFVSCHVIRVLA